jgi:aminopeptidase N
MAAASSRAVKRIEDVRNLRATQFPEDAGPMAHPIRPDAYQEINNFYTMTVYEKGAEVVRMLQTLVGRDGFRRGMDLYFERHDGQAVTCDDFVAAIADANARELTQFGRWYAQAGTPRLIVHGRHDAASRTYTLDVEQTHSGPDGALHIPLTVGLVGDDGQDLALRLATDAPARAARRGRAGPHAARSRVLELTEARHSFVFTGCRGPPRRWRAISARRSSSVRLHRARPGFPGRPRRRSLQSVGSLAAARHQHAAQRPVGYADGAGGRDAGSGLGQRAGRRTLDPAFRELMMALPGEA